MSTAATVAPASAKAAATALPSAVLPPWLIVFLLWVGVFVALAYGVPLYDMAADGLLTPGSPPIPV